MPQQVDYDALAREAGGRPSPSVDYDALAREVSGQPQAPARPRGLATMGDHVRAKSGADHVFEGLKTFAEGVNPVPMIDAVGRAMIPEVVGDAIGLNVPGKPKSGPVNFVNTILGASWDELKAAKTAFDAGDLVTATRHVLGSTPLIGPPLSQAGEELQSGEVGRGLGRTAAIGAQVALPAALAKGRSLAVRSPLRNGNATEAAAVEFAQRQGIPIDAATATGNRFVGGVQRGIADQSSIGSVVAERGRAAEAAALTRTGERLATRAHPTPVTPEQAGAAVTAAVTEKVTGAHQTAANAYARLRALEQQRAAFVQANQAVQAPPGAAKPFTDVPLAVDVAASKAALKPIYDSLLRESELGIPMQGGKGRALAALDGIMRGPDLAPLSAVDAALSDLKSLARGADLPELRTPGQGTAAAAVQALEAEVRAAANRGGPQVFSALMEGRLATRAKFGAVDVLEQLRTEPVQVFNQAIWQKDAGIAKLRDVAKLAPKEMAQIGRAYLEDLMGKATAQGGFDGAQGLWAQWQNLGPQTKRVMFRDPKLVADLDNFFLAAKKMGESPNPSGTALTMVKGSELAAWSWNPGAGAAYTLGAGAMAKLLRDPRAVRLLSRGLTLRVGGPTTALTALTTELAGLAKTNGVALVPVTAEATEPTPLR